MGASLEKHYEWKGKIEISSKVKVKSREELALAYTPGVAEACLEIAEKPEAVYDLTGRGNLVAVITDGTAVLGLGDIGPEASMPVMEGKCLLFKEFADVDAIPICVSTKDTESFISTVHNISKSFGGINLEDIAAPRCFEIESRLKELCDIPVFHDDQHGTAIVVAAALINSLKLVKKNVESIKVVINGAGSAGVAIGKLLLVLGVKNLIMCDINGAIYKGMDGLNPVHSELSEITNPAGERGTLADVLRGCDVFIGVSRPNLVTPEMVKSMAKDPIVFAMANPTPEIMPNEALLAGAKIVGTGRSDFPNQINNVLAFPGIFKGALSARAKSITEEMKLAAAYAIAGIIGEDELSEENVIASPFDKRVVEAVAQAVADTAKKQNVCR